ncbi:MAG: hypothetical protein AB7P21_31370 [Lautropia sp.]
MNELPQQLAEYRAGLEAELALLGRLEAMAARQRAASDRRDVEGLADVTADRERVMAALVALEDGLRPLRRAIAARRRELQQEPLFEAVASLHREAGRRVAAVLASDEATREALRGVEAARQMEARAIEQGESTLAAYRRVVAPGAPGATLVNRRG